MMSYVHSCVRCSPVLSGGGLCWLWWRQTCTPEQTGLHRAIWSRAGHQSEESHVKELVKLSNIASREAGVYTAARVRQGMHLALQTTNSILLHNSPLQVLCPGQLAAVGPCVLLLCVPRLPPAMSPTGTECLFKHKGQMRIQLTIQQWLNLTLVVSQFFYHQGTTNQTLAHTVYTVYTAHTSEVFK